MSSPWGRGVWKTAAIVEMVEPAVVKMAVIRGEVNAGVYIPRNTSVELNVGNLGGSRVRGTAGDYMKKKNREQSSGRCDGDRSVGGDGMTSSGTADLKKVEETLLAMENQRIIQEKRSQDDNIPVSPPPPIPPAKHIVTRTIGRRQSEGALSTDSTNVKKAKGETTWQSCGRGIQPYGKPAGHPRRLGRPRGRIEIEATKVDQTPETRAYLGCNNLDVVDN
ncbi:hypothetical protein EDD16DRAFT_1712668 [Pisolithus croceorrhizus]|nr:hypothetical protein EDD16DRAFT_1712668 [Pisolithus croceorrhizus]KAI6156502.1 hypothetical protein EDD17DRAFT_1764015 [Pisolithus thermaeus]